MASIPLPLKSLPEAGQFYEGRAPELGRRFLDTVEQTTESLAENPALGSPSSTTVRSLRVPQFPYAIVYRVESDRLFIVAVAHLRRRPKYWAGRVR